MWGTGVTSEILVILKPAAFKALTAESRPGPGPFTFTSRFLTPQSIAILLAVSAATCAANGVLSPLVGVIGSMQALEAIKLIVGFGQSLAGKLLVFDARYSQWRELKLPKDTQCPACSHTH